MGVVTAKRSTANPAAQAFGDLLRRIRVGRKLGLADVARASSIDSALLSKIETGKRLPPELPTLLRLTQALNIPEESEHFAELLSLTDQARNPALHAMAEKMRGGKSWNPFDAPMHEEAPVFCSTLAELISKSNEHAIRTNADSIIVKSESGVTTRFEILASSPKRSKKGGDR
jgi:transcriptional regulator with XRE-family HTH domain